VYNRLQFKYSDAGGGSNNLDTGCASSVWTLLQCRQVKSIA